MAKFRGSKGSVTLAGGAVGNLRSWECTISRAALDATCMGDTAKKTGLDTPGASGTLTALFDKGDTAQAALVAILISDTDVTPIAFVGLMDTGKSVNCNIVPTSAGISSQRGQYVEVSFPWESDGAITVPWA
jgi:hypothetical protein